jgi:hypothetical protein
VDGTGVLGNQPIGVEISGGTGNLIGGAATGGRNIISGNGLSGDGVGVAIINASTGNIVQGNFIGTNVSGTAALPNGIGVSLSDASANTIGGTTAETRNVISGNNSNGVVINGANATGNLVHGNLIGLRADGATALGNGGSGVAVNAADNTIGGMASGSAPLPNRPFGVGEQLNFNYFLGEGAQLVGTGSYRALARGTFFGRDGLLLASSMQTNGAGQALFPVNNQINSYVDPATLLPYRSEQHLREGDRNDNFIISLDQANGTAEYDDGTRVAIQNGTHDLVSIAFALRSFDLATGASTNVPLLIDRQPRTLNVTVLGRETIQVDGQTFAAVQLSLTDSFNNSNLRVFISDDTRRLPLRILRQTELGLLRADIATATGNLIAFNGGDGVGVDTGARNAVVSNSIFSNGGLGIRLINGGNNNQAAPVITSVINSDGNTIVQGTLNSTPNTTFNLQFFANPACDPSGRGEGQFIRATASVTTDANGSAAFSQSLAGALGEFITATATDANNNTSEFSVCGQAGAPVFSISGRVVDSSSGNGLGGVTINLTSTNGGTIGTTATDTNGNYSFANLASGDTYTVTPSLANYTFAPPSQTFENLQTNQTANFTGTLNTFTLSGQVTENGVALAGVTVTLSGTQSTTVMTDASGNYSFTVFGGGTYTVTPSLVNYTFAPPSQTFENLQANQTANFVGTRNTFAISGQVTENGAALSGVTITLSGGQSAATTTDANGNYSFTVFAGATYTVTPGLANYTFAPSSQTFENVQANQTANFTATRNTFAISGQVTENGAALAGVTITLSGSQSATVTTDASGTYSFTVAGGGNYTVTPSLANYTFVPSVANFTNLSANQTADFTATRNTFTISGQVTENGAALAGVTITLSGTQSATVTTDASGNYSFTIAGGGTYTVTPSLANYTFAPPSQTFENVQANQTANFVGTLQIFNLSGRVTDGSGNGLGGVTITLSGSQSATTTTAADGSYTFPVASGGTYTVAPSRSGFTFAPVERTFTNVTANITDADFTGTPVSAFTVTTTADSGAGSLRQAILDSNATPGTQAIVFNIAGSGVQTITPLSDLPFINDPVVIDGTTQPGFSGAPLIELNGSSTPATNPLPGLVINAGNSTVRGLVINRFNSAGISLLTNGNNLITGNYIGTDATGTLDLGNAFEGVFIGDSPNNVIGGTATGARNVISGNNSHGVAIVGDSSTGNVVRGNFIGTDAGGTNPLGNTSDGVIIGDAAAFTAPVTGTALNNVVGGTADNPQGNVIAFNGGRGVRVFSDASVGNSISFNNIFGNGALGIDLGALGVTPNDAGDADTGANNLQNFPVLSSAVSANGTANVQGTLNSTPNTTFQLEFFANPACDASGNGEGQFTRGTLSVTTDANGNVAFSQFVAGAVGEFITATATDPAGNTSEFSACVQATAPAIAISGRVTDANGNALANVTVTLSGSQSATTATDANGNYSFTNLAAGGNYTITPSQSGFSFTPSNRTFNNVTADITNANFTGTLLAPQVVSISPATGTEAGGTQVTITGSNFSGGTITVFFGQAQASNVTVVNDTTITATAPAGRGQVSVVVVRNGNVNSNNNRVFTYQPPPLANPQPAIMGTAGAGNLAVVFPRPDQNLPAPAQSSVTGLPAGSAPHGVSYFGSDSALISDFARSRVFVAQISTSSLVATIDTTGRYDGTGTIAVAPNLNFALAAANTSLAVISAPFNASSPIANVTLPGSVPSFQTQAIVFNAAGRAFVYHRTGISVLDAPYDTIAFTIPVANGSGAAIGITPDGNTLLTTDFSGTVNIFTGSVFSLVHSGDLNDCGRK